ncbi:MAG: glycine cleavage T C-terminal barrel domain-containing protein, partial [Granulosicoccaceae bacterium]
GFVATAGSTVASDTLGVGELRALWVVPCDHPLGQGKKKHFHEFQNDATAADLLLAQREGYVSVEHTKRYTTTGMANDQGKTSNINALGVVAQARGQQIPQVGITTFRPPFEPLTFGAIVGQNRNELFHMVRKTPMHDWAEENGGVFEDVGDWKRTWYYPRAGEDMHAAVYRECKQVRESVGMFDGSTLGKIDIQGPDAAWLLNMLYTNAWLKLAPGKCRYGLMLNEHGMVFDDGVTACIAENHYHMTTTTGGAARVLAWIEEWLQTEWPEKQVWCTSVTEQWAVIALNGPKAREVLAGLTDIDLDPETFQFMDWRAGQVAGVDARVYRISFTGECAFEINVPARYGRYVWERVHAAGQAHDIVTYGTESMHVLRAEKGFIIVGQDSDGTMTPADLGMDWIVSKAKPDFLGKRSHARTDVVRAGRKQLVGLLTDDPQTVLPEGTHIIEEVKPKPPMKMLGHVTSSYLSPNVDGGRSIAMASLKDGFNRMGDTVSLVLLDGTSVTAKVVAPVFVDKEGARSRS